MKTTAFKVTQAAIDKGQRTTNSKYPGWSDRCYKLLLKYISRKRTSWMCEDFIKWCEGKILMPDSLRAFGGVVRRASHRGIIKSVYKKGVLRLSAHSANANVWIKSGK